MFPVSFFFLDHWLVPEKLRHLTKLRETNTKKEKAKKVVASPMRQRR